MRAGFLPVASIFQRALGPAFARLHPRLQKRFALNAENRRAQVGRGTMEEIWYGRFYTRPFLAAGATRNILFPECGRNVPFEIVNWAYRDRYGRETVSFLRTFHMRRRRRFDAYMIYSPERRCIVDYLGTHQTFAVDLALSVEPGGALRFQSGHQRFYEGPLGFAFPRAISGEADVREWFDDGAGVYRIEVRIANRYWGPLFGYRGAFTVDWVDAPEGPPREARPVREQRRH